MLHIVRFQLERGGVDRVHRACGNHAIKMRDGLGEGLQIIGIYRVYKTMQVYKWGKCYSKRIWNNSRYNECIIDCWYMEYGPVGKSL